MKNFKPYDANPGNVFRLVKDKPNFKTAIIVLDTNVLLAPYRTSTEALEAIIGAYKELKEQARLYIPAQVAREFAKNRSTVLTNLHKQIGEAKTISINGKWEVLSILSSTAKSKEASEIFNEARAALKKFRQKIEELEAEISSWQNDDPVLSAYRPLFVDDIIIDCDIEIPEMQSIRKSRFEANIPPGNKDAAKDDGGVGDVLIWATILKIGKKHRQDLIFVTEENKSDWFHKAGEHKLFPRYELVEEYFRASEGHNFGIQSLSSMLKMMGADKLLVQEMATNEIEEINVTNSLPWLNNVVINKLLSLASLNNYNAIAAEKGFLGYELKSKDELILASIFNIEHPNPLDDLRMHFSFISGYSSAYSEIIIFCIGKDSATNRIADHLRRSNLINSNIKFIVIRFYNYKPIVLLNTCRDDTFHYVFPEVDPPEL
ncbi:PIN domain-containing protein [Delftia sp. WSY_7]|uniref:PIN domain-containing protein n=1 Tax=Delftia sp. WSY_7 TaxID=3367202 RepID=UPI00370BE24A